MVERNKLLGVSLTEHNKTEKNHKEKQSNNKEKKNKGTVKWQPNTDNTISFQIECKNKESLEREREKEKKEAFSNDDVGDDEQR